MAKRIAISTQVTLGPSATNFSAEISSAGLAVEVPEVDVTTMDDEGWNALLGGIKKGKLDLEAIYNGDQNLQKFVWDNLGSVVAFTIKGQDAATGVDNAIFSGNALITGGQLLRGKPGDAHGSSFSFPTSGPITRATV